MLYNCYFLWIYSKPFKIYIPYNIPYNSVPENMNFYFNISFPCYTINTLNNFQTYMIQMIQIINFHDSLILRYFKL